MRSSTTVRKIAVKPVLWNFRIWEKVASQPRSKGTKVLVNLSECNHVSRVGYKGIQILSNDKLTSPSAVKPSHPGLSGTDYRYDYYDYSSNAVITSVPKTAWYWTSVGLFIFYQCGLPRPAYLKQHSRERPSLCPYIISVACHEQRVKNSMVLTVGRCVDVSSTLLVKTSLRMSQWGKALNSDMLEYVVKPAHKCQHGTKVRSMWYMLVSVGCSWKYYVYLLCSMTDVY